jgi:hypothetical protein
VYVKPEKGAEERQRPERDASAAARDRTSAAGAAAAPAPAPGAPPTPGARLDHENVQRRGRAAEEEPSADTTELPESWYVTSTGADEAALRRKAKIQPIGGVGCKRPECLRVEILLLYTSRILDSTRPGY